MEHLFQMLEIIVRGYVLGSGRVRVTGGRGCGERLCVLGIVTTVFVIGLIPSQQSDLIWDNFINFLLARKTEQHFC